MRTGHLKAEFQRSIHLAFSNLQERKGEIRGPNYTEPHLKPQPLETTTHFLWFRVGGPQGEGKGVIVPK